MLTKVIISILYIGSFKELYLPEIRSCIVSKTSYSPRALMDFTK